MALYRIVDVDMLRTTTWNGVQWAYTPDGVKPSGDGWHHPPSAGVFEGDQPGLMWKRYVVPAIPTVQPEVITVGG